MEKTSFFLISSDIITGGAIGCVLLDLWFQVHEKVDAYLSNSPSLPGMVLQGS